MISNSQNNRNNWRLILILWPSWVWKWSLINLLKERRPDFSFPISLTTRKPREWEINGQTYFFTQEDEFKSKINSWEFLEYANVHWSYYYWLLKEPVLKAIWNWKIVIREVDVQWFDSISNILDKDHISSIFVLPPPLEILKNRIRKRSNISSEELERRISSLDHEMKYSRLADYTIDNIEGDLEAMYDDLIIKIDLIVSN